MTTTDVPPRNAATAYPIRIDAVGPGEFVWRLTASNGRSIARSAPTFASSAAALAALDQLVTFSAKQRLPGTVGHRAGGGWGWTMNDARGRAVAHSPRTFERHGSCARSLQLFRAALVALSTPVQTA